MTRDPMRPGGTRLKVGARGQRILHTGAWSLIAKASAAANLFLTIPFVLQALGASQFGVWATLVSLVTFAGFLDFGLGNGTMNMVATAHGQGNEQHLGTIVREARRALLLIAILLAVISAAAIAWVPWHRLVGVPDTMSDSARTSVAIVLFTIALAVPLNLANRVQLGMGQGERAFRWQAIGQAITAFLVILLARHGASMEMLVAAAVATPLLASAANNLQLWRAPVFANEGCARNPAVATEIRNEGALFFVLQLAALLAFSIDLPLISALLGSEEAGNYAIVQRLFSVIPMGLGLLWTPLWPIYRQALAAGDHAWVRRTLKRSIIGAVSLAIAGALFIGFGFDVIIGFWIKKPLPVSGWLVAGFAIWCVVDAAGTAIATFFNAASIVRYQVVVAIIFAMACLATKVTAVGYVGIAGVPWATIATYSLISLAPTIVLLPRLLAHATSRRY